MLLSQSPCLQGCGRGRHKGNADSSSSDPVITRAEPRAVAARPAGSEPSLGAGAPNSAGNSSHPPSPPRQGLGVREGAGCGRGGSLLRALPPLLGSAFLSSSKPPLPSSAAHLALETTPGAEPTLGSAPALRNILQEGGRGVAWLIPRGQAPMLPGTGLDVLETPETGQCRV